MFQQCGLTAVNLDSYASYHQQPAKCWPTEAERNSVCVLLLVLSYLERVPTHKVLGVSSDKEAVGGD